MGILSNIVNEKKTKTRLDPKCWDGYKKQGTKMKDGVRVNNCVKEDGSPWTTTGKHPEQMDADELRDELAVFDELRDRGEHLSPQELAREDTLWDYLEQIDGPQVQYEGEMSDIDAEAQEFVRGAIETAKSIQQDNYYFSDSTYYEFTDELDTDNEALMDHPLVQKTLESLPHVDMEPGEIKQAVDALANMQIEEAITEAPAPYDMTDKGDMHDALGDVLTDLKKAEATTRQVYDAVENAIYADESVEVSETPNKPGYCSDDCCGADVKKEDCNCPPDCKGCDCGSTVDEHDAKGIRKIASKVPFIGHKLHGHDHMPAPAEPVEEPDEPYDDAILRIARKKKTEDLETEIQRLKDLVKYR